MNAASLNTTQESWTIAELSAEFGVTARALRFYEERGLISPQRIGSQRVYSERDRVRLRWIERAKSVGFSLEEVGELLDLYHTEGGPEVQRRVTIERCREQLAKLERQQNDIVWAMGVLKDFIEEVEATMSPDNGED